MGDISVNFKREKFKFFSEIRIPNSLKVNARNLPFEISIDYPNKVTLYQKFKIKVKVTSFVEKDTEYSLKLTERYEYPLI